MVLPSAYPLGHANKLGRQMEARFVDREMVTHAYFCCDLWDFYFRFGLPSIFTPGALKLVFVNSSVDVQVAHSQLHEMKNHLIWAEHDQPSGNPQTAEIHRGDPEGAFQRKSVDTEHTETLRASFRKL